MKKILVANRGEIAVRIIRTIQEMGHYSIAVYSVADASSLHVALADEAICIGDVKTHDSYLNIDNILMAAEVTRADAIHPGYGFLAESPEFSRRCQEMGLIFIGPEAETMELLGNKVKARATVKEYGLPVVEGSDCPVKDYSDLEAICSEIGYPVMIKAVSGGGGKGMRIVNKQAELKKKYEDARKEADVSFADNRIYVEKYIDSARHIEVQILADGRGNAVHFYERDCSIQRNNQKIIEEAPAVILEEATRDYITRLTADVFARLNYRGLGTVEYLYVEEEKKFYFMEMNTRIQVEHPITEMITGVDLVEEQIYTALNNELRLSQEDISYRGVAIEVRINAEDPSNGFMPAPGPISRLHFGLGRDIRVDSHIYAGYIVPAHYDSMIGKIIAHGKDRKEAVNRMRRSLGETVIEPVTTNLNFLFYIMTHAAYQANDIDIHFLTKHNVIE